MDSVSNCLLSTNVNTTGECWPQAVSEASPCSRECGRNSQLVKVLGIMKCGVLYLKLDNYKTPSEVQGIYGRCKRQEGSFEEQCFLGLMRKLGRSSCLLPILTTWVQALKSIKGQVSSVYPHIQKHIKKKTLVWKKVSSRHDTVIVLVNS